MPSISIPGRVSYFTEPFIATLDAASPVNARDDPNYYSRYPRSLTTTSSVDTFMTGTGSAIYKALVPLLESTAHELILVTCFWARSSTLDTLNQVLKTLSEKAIHRGTHKIRIRLCFSSSSLFQKLFHNQNVTGQTYPREVWVKKLGLPDPNELGGLDIKIKSVFILPFSVMHPKFIIMDRKTVVLPSCNISWEEWFEGAVTLSGPVVSHFLKFYFMFWERRQDMPELPSDPGESASTNSANMLPLTGNTLLSRQDISISNTHAVFLPSPHRRNPNFSPFTPPSHILAPPTPLNTFLLTILAKSQNSIMIQTPNLTSPPVLSALLNAVKRGVAVRIRTSARLMILEQLGTAGTTTARCIKKLIKRYKALIHTPYSSKHPSRPDDEEQALPPLHPGRLHITFFEPRGGPKRRGQENGEPQQSHLKMTIVDNEVVVLGSGNLDRASWFTSQELGVALFGEDTVERVREGAEGGVIGRERVVFDSEVRG